MNRKLFATAAKGIEPVLAKELLSLGAADVREEIGGVSFSGDIRFMYKANLWLRTANRVLLQISEFECKTEDQLYFGVQSIDWRNHMTADMTLAVDANSRRSKITHSKYAALKVKDAVVDQLRSVKGRRPSIDTLDPDLRINAHIVNDVCTLSLDSSGDSLNKRGYRVGTVKAPLRETLAAALIEFTGWEGQIPFIDPMCGSGTIVIEAALKAAQIAPGLLRKKYGFQRWVGYEKKIWAELVKSAERVACNEIATSVMGYDISNNAIRAAISNAQVAGVGKLVSFDKVDIQSLKPPPGPGVLIVNPPYGERIGDIPKLEVLYENLGDVLKQRCKGYTAYVFAGNLDLAKRIGLKTSKRIPLYNGPIESRLLKFELY